MHAGVQRSLPIASSLIKMANGDLPHRLQGLTLRSRTGSSTAGGSAWIFVYQREDLHSFRLQGVLREASASFGANFFVYCRC